MERAKKGRVGEMGAHANGYSAWLDIGFVACGWWVCNRAGSVCVSPAECINQNANAGYRADRSGRRAGCTAALRCADLFWSDLLLVLLLHLLCTVEFKWDAIGPAVVTVNPLSFSLSLFISLLLLLFWRGRLKKNYKNNNIKIYYQIWDEEKCGLGNKWKS